MLSMVIFVRGVAVLVGLANVYGYGLYNGVHDASLSGLPRSELLVEVCVTVVTGLVISEIVLRFARPALQGGFYARYAAAAATVFLGGLTLGASLPMALVLAYPPQGGPNIGGVLIVGVFGGVIGLALGVLEGLILAFPLATILGLFRGRT